MTRRDPVHPVDPVVDREKVPGSGYRSTQVDLDRPDSVDGGAGTIRQGSRAPSDSARAFGRSPPRPGAPRLTDT